MSILKESWNLLKYIHKETSLKTKALTAAYVGVCVFSFGGETIWKHIPLPDIPNKDFEKLEQAVKRRQNKHKAQFGTIENPKFTINTDIDMNYYEINQLELMFKKERYEKLIQEIRPSFTELDQIEQSVFSNQDIDSELIKERLEHISSKAWSIKQSFDETQKEFSTRYSTKILPPEFELKPESQDLEDIIEPGKRIFKALTGEEFPDSTKISFEEMEYIGFHQAWRNKIGIYEKLDYVAGLYVFFHESGHLIYQNDEKAILTILTDKLEDEKSEKETEFMEEAAAYLFEFAGIQILKRENPLLGKKAELDFIRDKNYKISNYQNGSEEEHDKGFALACSIMTHFDYNIKRSFNYLSTKSSMNELEPEIRELFESYRTDNLWMKDKPFINPMLLEMREESLGELHHFMLYKVEELNNKITSKN